MRSERRMQFAGAERAAVCGVLSLLAIVAVVLVIPEPGMVLLEDHATLVSNTINIHGEARGASVKAEKVAAESLVQTKSSASQGVSQGMSVTEASALHAVQEAKKAAAALRAARIAVIKMVDLGDKDGMVATLKTEQQAKTLYRRLHGRAKRFVRNAQTSGATEKALSGLLVEPQDAGQVPVQVQKSNRGIGGAMKEQFSVGHVEEEGMQLNTQQSQLRRPDSQLMSTGMSFDSHDPGVVESEALAAITRAKKAAQALRSARTAVTRLQEIGDTVGTATALKTESQAKKAFITAREKSAPLVAEARANYEASQGTALQHMAKQVAQHTWESMTSTGPPPRSGVPYAGAVGASPYPLPQATPGFAPQYGTPPYPAANSAGYPSPGSSVVQPQGMIRRAGVQVARQYAAEARAAQANALAAQRNAAAAYASLNPPPPHGLQPGAVTAVARYAKQAEAAMNAAQAARAAAKENVIKHGKRKNKKAKAKAKASAKPTASSAGDVISGAERDIVASMHTVADAARRHGMADSSWQTRIGTLMKNGQTAEASQAANQYIQNRINQAVSAKLQHASVNQASHQISQARKAIAAAAKRHAKKEMALELLAAAHLSREHRSMLEAARTLRNQDDLQEGRILVRNQGDFQEGLDDDGAQRGMRRQRHLHSYRRSRRYGRSRRQAVEHLIDLLASP